MGEWGKIFAKGSIFRIYKKLKKSNTKRINDSINKWIIELKSFLKKMYKWLINT
jgi:hypothetical protein